MSLVLGIEKDTWEVITNALSAVGTVAAVVVALALAKRERPSLSVTAAMNNIYTDHGPDEGEQSFVVKGTNVGNAPVLVQGVYWEVGKGKQKITFISSPEHYKALPKLGSVITHGQQVMLMLPCDCLSGIAERAASSAVSQNTASHWFTKHLHVGIYTTVLSFKTRVTGEAFQIYEKAFEERLRQLNHQQKS